MDCFAAVSGELEFIRKADAEDRYSVTQFRIGAKVVCEIIPGSYEWG